MSKKLNGLIRLVAATLIYAGWVVYLYQPYFEGFKTVDYLFLVNGPLASVGAFLLSRRWVATFAGSFFAGAVYGFGPFMLGLACFHPSAGFLAAVVPWLFLPAAYGPGTRWRRLNWPLSTLPFLAILLFFQLSAHYRLFAIPTQLKLHLADLAGLLAPLIAMKRCMTLVGFYHVPIAALIMGFSMLLAARRLGIIIIFAVGTTLAFCDSVLDVSPIIWLTIPSLCCSVLIAEGMQGLISAGRHDRQWVLATAGTMAALSIVTLLLATECFKVFAGLGASYGRLFVLTAKMYILGAVAVGVIFFMARAKLRVHWLRLILLCSAMAVDMFFGARFIVDKIF